MNGPPTARTRHPKSTTRSIILEKAYEMYLDRRLTPGDERLAAVLDELGYTTGAGYQIWANQAAFREDLTGYVAENIDYASLRSLGVEVVELGAQDLSFRDHVLVAGDRYAAAFIGREEFYVKLRFLAMSDDRPDAVTKALVGAYEEASWEASQLFESTLGRFGRQVRAGLEMSDLTTAVTASLEGYALRTRVQPSKVSAAATIDGETHHVFSWTLLAMFEQFTEQIPSDVRTS